MLTGMIPPTSGYAIVAGYDIRTDLSLLRENIGVCLQHDCLFPQLTVEEHVVFFSTVKGLYTKKSKEECQKSVISAIEDVALLEKRQCFSKDLSGGMKRKLSVAIAFCGDSKVVFLVSTRFVLSYSEFAISMCLQLILTLPSRTKGRANKWHGEL